MEEQVPKDLTGLSESLLVHAVSCLTDTLPHLAPGCSWKTTVRVQWEMQEFNSDHSDGPVGVR